MTRIELKKSFRDTIINDPELQGKIAKAANKSVQTVKRWAEQNSEMLLLAPVLDALRDYLTLNEDEMLTELVETASLETINQ